VAAAAHLRAGHALLPFFPRQVIVEREKEIEGEVTGFVSVAPPWFTGSSLVVKRQLAGEGAKERTNSLHANRTKPYVGSLSLE